MADEICEENDIVLSKICQGNELGWVQKPEKCLGRVGVKNVLRIAYSNRKNRVLIKRKTFFSTFDNRRYSLY